MTNIISVVMTRINKLQQQVHIGLFNVLCQILLHDCNVIMTFYQEILIEYTYCIQAEVYNCQPISWFLLCWYVVLLTWYTKNSTGIIKFWGPNKNGNPLSLFQKL